MKSKLTIIFLFIFLTFYGQNIVIDVTDKTEESKENPAYDIRIIEPKTDSIHLNEKKKSQLYLDTMEK